MAHDFQTLIRYFQDVHALEQGGMEVLDAFNPGFASIEATEIVERYKLVCEDHLRALNGKLASFGAGQSAAKGIMNVIFGKAADFANINQGGEDRTTFLLVRYYGNAQLKGAMYDAIWAYATGLNDKDSADLALKFRQEEFDWALAIFPFIAESTKGFAKPSVTPPPVQL